MRGLGRVERGGAIVLVALTLLTLVVVSVSALMRIGAEDLYAAAAVARGSGEVPSRTVYGRWLSAQLSSDIADAGYDVLQTRADELSYRSDRLRELAAVPALIGLIAALLTDAPEPVADPLRRDAKLGGNRSL
jgi:hypothetical protein